MKTPLFINQMPFRCNRWIDKTTNQISGVEAGTNTKDAVNKGQLDALAAQQAASDNAAVK
ncbi:hypothetical protein, partial [Acinetobacter junii]|uniref:hypothetical protein n=1 Tax=Acinetobacter junii TaxID=40215 RepID=UPI00148F0D9D